MSPFTTPGLARFAEEVDAERARQLARFGDQRHPDGTGNVGQQEYAESARRWCQDAFGCGYGTWADVLDKKVAEAKAERDPARLRAELIQVSAVCAAWVSDLDRRPAAPACQCLPASPAAPRIYCDACLAAGVSPS
ncbi:hypothetical protein ACFXPI_11125 [Streptomyces sp. NPDC059104]|uniref:hypothetical protein n=1 Tax=Streptomyces sp. NPDC059104 TaxID=3346729 RepID=UPI0036B9E88C